jgi:hypothetical protein
MRGNLGEHDDGGQGRQARLAVHQGRGQGHLQRRNAHLPEEEGHVGLERMTIGLVT